MTSTRLSEVRTQADADRLWEEIAESGAPLIEEDGHLVTFLWRDDGRTRNVVVVGGPARWDPLGADLMQRLPGTDVWHRSYHVEPPLIASYQLSVNDSLEAPDQITDWALREFTFRADPLNPHGVDWPAHPSDLDQPARRTSILAAGAVMPASPAGAGSLDEIRVTSELLGNTRTVWVHAPRDARDAQLLIVLDGWVWAQVLPISGPLEGIRAAGRPLVLALVDSLDTGTRIRELEGNPDTTRFLVEELVPLLRTRYPVSGRIGVLGQSLGGLTAVAAALAAPEVIAVAGAQSGSFWWPRDDADAPQEHLTARVLAQQPVDVRICLEVGSYEGADMIDTARRLHAALAVRGYDADHREHSGGHDWLRWWCDLPALVARMFA
ncbi:MAG: alpha/beta hydrolase-fold protein [Microbacterium sp.]